MTAVVTTGIAALLVIAVIVVGGPGAAFVLLAVVLALGTGGLALARGAHRRAR